MDKRANPQKDYPLSIFGFSRELGLLEEDLYSENQYRKERELKMDIKELIKQKEEIERQIVEEQERIRTEKEKRTLDKINSFTEESKNYLLSFIEHDRTSCSDENPCNGYSYWKNNFRCRKCMLIEILNGDHSGDFDFKITVDITKNE